MQRLNAANLYKRSGAPDMGPRDDSEQAMGGRATKAILGPKGVIQIIHLNDG
jgi:hypothetical protein